MQKLAIAIAAIATLASTSVFAADMPVNAPPATVWSWSGFYIGAGGSFNWTRFDQALQGVSGIQTITIGQDEVALAQEGGSFFPFNRNESRFAPDVQLGYNLPFAGSDWLAGLKFDYKYPNIHSRENVSIPQSGTLTRLVGPPLTENITGFVQISPAEINLRHQLTLVATIGRAFDRLTIYAGGGPALFDVETNFINGVAFAVIRGFVISASGAPITFFNDDWVWGGAAQVGATYALAPRWFLDFAYTYARSANFNISNPSCFGNQTGPLASSGCGVVNAQERVTNQSVTLTLNRQF
ncbi:MAG: outer membrane protein [Xanthobacteraceae bacterium]